MTHRRDRGSRPGRWRDSFPLSDFDHPEIEERVLRYRSQLVDWYSTSVTERFKKKAALAEEE